MSPSFLIALSALYGGIAVYFCWRYYLRRRLPSLVCAFMPVGWVVAYALQQERLDERWLPFLFVASLLVGVLSLAIIVNHELQREKPFR
jgi:hypothetical protein